MIAATKKHAPFPMPPETGTDQAVRPVNEHPKSATRGKQGEIIPFNLKQHANSMPACRDCGHWLLTTSGLNKHISNSLTCRQKWQDRLKNFSINVFDLGHGFAPQVEEDNDHEDEDSEIVPDGDYNEGPDFSLDDGLDSPPHSFEAAVNVEATVDEDHEHVNVQRPNAYSVQIEEVADDPGPFHHATARWVEEYPDEMLAGAPCGNAEEIIPTKFDTIKHNQELNGQSVWGPFDDEEEWELARWLIQNVGQTKTDEFLKLPIVSMAFWR